MELLPIFKGLSDPVRLRIVQLLNARDELCVCHLTAALQLPQSTVSRHLNILKQAEIVSAERRGQWVYYRLADAAVVGQLADMVSTAADECYRDDLARLCACEGC